MRFNRFAAFAAFLSLMFVTVVAWFRRIAGETARLDAAEKEVEEAKATVAAKEAAASEAATRAVETHAEVEKRLADLDKVIAEERKRDTVDVANDIIGGK
jgi:Tfp pilus assembly protein PilO